MAKVGWIPFAVLEIMRSILLLLISLSVVRVRSLRELSQPILPAPDDILDTMGTYFFHLCHSTTLTTASERVNTFSIAAELRKCTATSNQHNTTQHNTTHTSSCTHHIKSTLPSCPRRYMQHSGQQTGPNQVDRMQIFLAMTSRSMQHIELADTQQHRRWTVYKCERQSDHSVSWRPVKMREIANSSRNLYSDDKILADRLTGRHSLKQRADHLESTLLFTT